MATALWHFFLFTSIWFHLHGWNLWLPKERGEFELEFCARKNKIDEAKYGQVTKWKDNWLCTICWKRHYCFSTTTTASAVRRYDTLWLCMQSKYRILVGNWWIGNWDFEIDANDYVCQKRDRDACNVLQKHVHACECIICVGKCVRV